MIKTKPIDVDCFVKEATPYLVKEATPDLVKGIAPYLVKSAAPYDDKIEIYFNKPTRTSPDDNQGFSFYTEKKGDIIIEIKV